MREFWEYLWGFGVEYRAEILALLAVLVSTYAAYVARRNAAAAEVQAEAAADDVRIAQRALDATREFSEIQALEAARARMEQAAPSVVVTLDRTETPLVASGGLWDLPVPHPDVERAAELTLDYREHQHDYLYIVLRGTLYNDRDAAARVYVTEQRFYEGLHPITGVTVPIPRKSTVDGCYVLHPQQMAFFEIRAARNMWDVLNHYRKPDASRNVHMSRDAFIFRPGAVNEPPLHVTIVTELDEPISLRPEEPWDAPILVKERCWVEVKLEREIRLPKSFEYVHAELQQDNERIYNLQWRDHLMEVMREKDN